MAQDLRQTGLSFAGDVSWGTHFCHFYETRADLLDILVPYFKAGLEHHEYCLWIVHTLAKEEARNALRQVVPDLDRYIFNGSLEIIPYTDWYSLDGTPDLDQTITEALKKLSEALVRGYAGMRSTGDVHPGNGSSQDFSNYEKTINHSLRDRRILLLCTYPLSACSAADILDVARTHEFAVARRRGNWEIIETCDLKHERLALAVQAAQLGTWEHDLVKGTLSWTERTRELLGVPGDIVASIETFFDAMHPDDRERVAAAFQTACDRKANGLCKIEYRTRTMPDGAERWVVALGTVFFDDTGKPVRVIGVIMDITERKHAEDALRTLAEKRDVLLAREREALARSEEANRLKDELLAMISHELKTPLTNIVGWTRLLRQRQLDAARSRQAIEAIDRNATLETRLVNDILDMFSIVTGKLSIQLQPVTLQDIVAAALESVRAGAEAKGVEVESRLCGRSTIHADPQRLQQAFWNLLSNAIKFTPQGGRITVTTEHAGAEVRTIIKDSGVGIRRESLPHLFERFWQADSSLTRAHGGLGLGLTIAGSIVESHKGNIEAHSSGPGQGATFIVTLHAA